MIRPAIIPSLTVRLRASDRAALLDHFLALGPEDRRLRFGNPLKDESIRDYVKRLHFARDHVFAVHDGAMRLLAVVHVAFGSHASRLQGYGPSELAGSQVRSRVQVSPLGHSPSAPHAG